jgi:hypothetical protein
LRVLGDAVDSCARFAAAHPRPMLLLLLVVVGLYVSSQDYKPEQPACEGGVGPTSPLLPDVRNTCGLDESTSGR